MLVTRDRFDTKDADRAFAETNRRIDNVESRVQRIEESFSQLRGKQQ